MEAHARTIIALMIIEIIISLMLAAAFTMVWDMNKPTRDDVVVCSCSPEIVEVDRFPSFGQCADYFIDGTEEVQRVRALQQIGLIS